MGKKEKLMPLSNPVGYQGMLIKDDETIYFFYTSSGEVITRTKSNMESRYEKLIEPFEFFPKRVNIR